MLCINSSKNGTHLSLLCFYINSPKKSLWALISFFISLSHSHKCTYVYIINVGTIVLYLSLQNFDDEICEGVFWKDEVLVICSHTKEITRPNGMLSGEHQLRAPISVVLDDTYCRDDPMTVNNFLQEIVEFTSSHFSNTFSYRQHHLTLLW